MHTSMLPLNLFVFSLVAQFYFDWPTTGNFSAQSQGYASVSIWVYVDLYELVMHTGDSLTTSSLSKMSPIWHGRFYLGCRQGKIGHNSCNLGASLGVKINCVLTHAIIIAVRNFDATYEITRIIIQRSARYACRGANSCIYIQQIQLS